MIYAWLPTYWTYRSISFAALVIDSDPIDLSISKFMHVLCSQVQLDPCQSAVRNAVADLGKTFSVQVDRVEIRETKAAGNAESPYSDRTKEALILLYAPSRRTRSALPSSNINTHDHISLKSKELIQRSDLMTSYSAFLVNKCPNLAKISFGLNYTGWIRSFSLVKGDYVRPDTCLWVSRDRTQISKWGESVCVD